MISVSPILMAEGRMHTDVNRRRIIFFPYENVLITEFEMTRNLMLRCHFDNLMFYGKEA